MSVSFVYLRLTKKRALRKVFGPKRGRVSGG
jgi:hypothetical protein